MSKKSDKFRSKSFMLLLYDEDETHRKAMDKIKSSYDYACILHDKDVYEEDEVDSNTGELIHRKGDLKKPHYHFVVRFNNQRWNTALAEELGITQNYIMQPDSFDRALAYLVHHFEPEKYQYPIEEVSGPLKFRLIQVINHDNKTESERVLEILEIIDNSDSDIQFSVFCKYMAKMGYWSDFRRSASLFMRYIDEHNKKML